MFYRAGVAAVGVIGALAAFDVDTYATTLGGWARLLGSITAVILAIGVYWQRWGRPAKERAKRALVSFVRDAVTEPLAANTLQLSQNTQKLEGMSGNIREIAEGNEHRTQMIQGILTRMDVADQKIEVVAIKLAASQRNSPVPIVWTDAKGNVTDTTQGYHDLMGIDTHGARDKGWKQRVYAPERERVDAEWTKIASAGHHDVMRFHVYAEPDDTMIQLVESDIQTLKMNDKDRTVFGYQATMRRIGQPRPTPEKES